MTLLLAPTRVPSLIIGAADEGPYPVGAMRIRGAHASTWMALALSSAEALPNDRSRTLIRGWAVKMAQAAGHTDGRWHVECQLRKSDRVAGDARAADGWPRPEKGTKDCSRIRQRVVQKETGDARGGCTGTRRARRVSARGVP